MFLRTLFVPSVYQPRRPRASPLWQILTAAWEAFLATYEKKHHTTKRNFEIFKAPDFIAAIIDHLPPKGKQTVRYYGLHSNKTRGQQPLIPAPPKQSARSMRPLWRDLILKVWRATLATNENSGESFRYRQIPAFSGAFFL
jgi:hypothetical protein